MEMRELTRLPKLDSDEIQARLGTVSGWSLAGDRLVKKYRLKDSVQALAFVNAVGQAAEAAQHHPDILIRYSLVKVVDLGLRHHHVAGL